MDFTIDLMDTSKQKLLSKIPQIDQLLKHPDLQPLCLKFSRKFVRQNLQEVVEQFRKDLLEKKGSVRAFDSIESQIIKACTARIEQFLRPSLQKAINGTGIILHTGLGRAPLSKIAQENLLLIANGYCNLELDLKTGKRGERNSHVETLLCALTGAEAACIVNNNAAAVLLALNTLSFRKEAIVSRGQLIEIGGSFRIPEVMEKSGAKMVEVGTTNKTHLKDYEKAITKSTGLICVVHPSNYRVRGFTADVNLGELVELAERKGIPVLQDLGGGILVDLREYDLPYEPVVRENVRLGFDVITFSGDKVLGGPQSGIIVGKKKYIEEIKSNPLMRALRCDKLIYSALEATLRLFLQEKELLNQNCVFQMLLKPVDELHARASKLAKNLSEALKDIDVKVEDSTAEIGSGALPLEQLPSKAISLKHPSIATQLLAKKFRFHTPPIVGYIRDDRLYFDLRTVFEEEDEVLIRACRQILV